MRDDMTVLVVEDDQFQADALIDQLRRIAVEPRHIATELEFYQLVQSSDLSNVRAAVVDMMLRWTDPAPDMEPAPKEVATEGYFTAGLRCCRKLALEHIPCIIFTALDPSSIPLKSGENIPILNKSQGFEPLIERLKPLLEKG